MAKLYIGRISDKVRERDMYDLFGKYGKLKRVDLKAGFGFIEYDDRRDGEDAIKALDGYDFMGERMYVDMAFTQGELPDFRRRRPIPGEGRCHRCGIEGHWARECPQNRDSDRGRRSSSSSIGRSSRYQPYSRDRRSSRSRSPSPRRHRYSRSPSPRRSRRSPSPRRHRSPSPRRRYSRSPPPRSPLRRSPPRRSSRSPPPRRDRSPPPRDRSPPRNRSPPSPRKRDISPPKGGPIDPGRDQPYPRGSPPMRPY